MQRMQTEEEWRAMQTRNFRMAVLFAQGHRSPRRKPRDPVEDAILLRFAIDSVRERAASGRLVRIGPRHYELRSKKDDAGPQSQAPAGSSPTQTAATPSTSPGG
jgi:hypothetical protein